MESPKLPSFSDAIDVIGMGPFQSRLVFVSGVGWMFNGIETLNIAFVMDDIADTFELDSLTKGIVGGSGFLGMIFGAIFWSVFADKRGRRSAFLLSLICIVVSGFATALAGSATTLIVLRVIVGFGVGGNIPVTNVLLAEYLPTSHRASLLCRTVGVSWSLCIVLMALLGLALGRALGPGREEDMWRCFLGLSAVPGAIALVLVACGLLPESPRFLSFVGKHDEAVDIMEEVARVNGVNSVLGVELSQLTTEEERVRLEIQPASIDLGEKEGHAAAGGVFELFQAPTSRRATVCVWTIWFFLHTSYYGFTFLMPKYFKSISGDSDTAKYILSIVLGLVFCPSAFVALWACTEDRLGRVGTMKWFSWSSVMLLLFMAATINFKAFFLTVSMLTYFITGVPVIASFVVTPELYSTKHRVVGLASANVLSRVGGLLAPILAEVLYEKGRVWPLAALGPFMMLVAIASGLIPFETAGKKLDDPTSDDESEQVS